jgi:asparagine synthase (glutamine-hydrolysing)
MGSIREKVARLRAPVNPWDRFDACSSWAGNTLCGIAGEIRFDGRAPSVDAVAAITERLASRGPDGAGLWSSGPVALGHRRLAIIDLSRRGDQPMVDPELGLTVVFNGCIYNHRALRAELEGAGYRFFSNSDTEVLLKGWHRWGEGLVDRLAGMFAFCIVERDSGRSVLVRDRLGIKPLYLAETPGALRFASALPALVAGGGVDTTVDPIALHHYLTFHAIVPAPRTILAGVSKLPPATLLVVEPDGRRRERRYWQPSHDVEGRPQSPGEWREAVAAALRLAVERRTVSDVPVGVLLSGGLDSSLIVGLLRERGQDKLSTFSIGFDTIGDEEGDEFSYSDVVAERFDTDHHQIRIPTDRVLSALQPTVAAMSEPMVSHDVVAFYLLSQEVSQHVKVVQSGQGADEVFAGYHWYQKLAGVAGDGVAEYASVFFDRTRNDIAEAVEPEYLPDTDVSLDFVTRHFAEPGASSAVKRALRIDTHVMLVEDPVKRVDNTTMAWGLEGRVPFLDHELVELASACPPELKLAGGGKGILKDLARAVIPHEVIDRPKGYFPVPPLIVLEGPYVDLLRDALTSPAAKERGLFRPDHVRHLLDRPNELTTLRYNKLWELGLLELWLQTHVN